MVFVSNLFAHPEKLGEARKCLDILRYQIKMFEALEPGKQRLSKTSVLNLGMLDNCLTFMQYVDTEVNFSYEVSKLSLNELIFAIISFEGKRLKTLLDLFKASDVKKYIEKENINCLRRSEIFKRINYYMPKLGGRRFVDIYENAKSLNESNIVLHEGKVKVEFSIT